MQTATLSRSHQPVSRAPSVRSAWAGRVLFALPVLFLAFDTVIKLIRLPVAVEASRQLGFSAESVFVIGVIEAICLTLYVLPKTAPLGAILWVGYFGGAIATHLRSGSPLFTHTLSPLVFAALMWAALWLTDTRFRRIARSALAPGI